LIGYLLPRWFSECVAQLSIACLLAGLIATVLSVPLWYVLQQKTGKPNRELHNVFNKFYGEPRVFEADESGWKYSTGTKEDSRQWSDVFTLVRSGQTLVLMDQFHSYPLPVSALPADQLKALEQIGSKNLSAERLFSVPMAATAADFMIANGKHNWFKQTAKMLLLYGCGLLFLGTIGLALADSSPQNRLSPWFWLLFLFLPAVEAAHYHSLYSRYWQRSFQNADVLQQAICFRIDTLHSVSEMWKIRYEWFEAVVETKRVLMLYFHKNSIFLIPKAGLTADQLAQVRRLLALPAE
jgi:hypothetical protein